MTPRPPVWNTLQSRAMQLKPWPEILAQLRVDPYLAWADASNFAGFAGFENVSIAFELNADCDPKVVDRVVKLLSGRAVSVGPSFGFASCPIKALPKLLDLRVQEYVRRFELGMPLAGHAHEYAAGVCSHPAVADEHDADAPNLGSKLNPVVAVIDDGCAFANTAFRTFDKRAKKWRTRIKSLWFQEERHVYDFDAPTLEGWLNAAGNAVVNEEACYAAMRDTLRKRIESCPDGDPRWAERWWQRMQAPALHGTHVLDVFAGAPNPLDRYRAGKRGKPDIASSAPILFVQLPRSAIDDTSGLSMNVCVLEALARIAARVDGRPTVVNLSFGSLAGPHDGSSLLEAAMDHFLEHHPHIQIVLPAGNGYNSLTHACVQAEPDQSWHELSLRILPDDPTDTFIELWYDAQLLAAGEPATGRALVDVELVAPDGSSSGAVALNDAKEAVVDGYQLPTMAIVHQSRPPTSASSAKNAVLAALAATRCAGQARAPAQHGVWKLRVRNSGGSTVKIDAWIERDDSAFGSGRSRGQAVFLSRGALPARGLARAATGPIARDACLNSIAHGSRTVVVGGSVLKSREIADYSASGPGRLGKWEGPEYVAPCEDAPGIGLQASGTRSGTLVHMNGTSVAAPVVARMLLNRPRTRDQKSPPLDIDEKLQADPVPRRGRGLVNWEQSDVQTGPPTY